MLAVPYTIAKVPYDAKSAQERMKVGDFVQIPADMSLVLGVDTDWGFSSVFSPTAYANLIVSGNFTINLYRKSEHEFRLKLISRTRSSARGGGRGKFNFGVTGVDIVDKGVEKIFELDVIDIFLEKGLGEQYIVDLEFDLSKKHVRDAFDKILKPTFKLNMNQILWQYQGKEFFEKRLMADLEPAFLLAKKR